MPYHNPKEIVPDDFKALRSWSLEEVDGAPILHMSLELHPHREYDPEPTSLYLPSIDPRRLIAPEPVNPVAEETAKQEAVQPSTESDTPKKKGKSSSSSDDSAPADTSKTEDNTPAPKKADDSASAAPKTGQGG